MDIQTLLQYTVEKQASDLHLKAGSPPFIRVDGELIKTEFERLSPTDTVEVAYALMNEKQAKRFAEHNEVDFAYSIAGLGRFRANIFKQRGTVGIAIRRVLTTAIPSFEELGLPPVLRRLAEESRGLILVTGPAGSGKTTTLAAIIDYINTNKKVNIITIEDPIEYLFQDDKCVIAQRELGQDTWSFAKAPRHVLRQDPDVILVGEMRDLETISTAITAAETGHLVLSTLHTPNAPQAIDRMIDAFPPHQQEQIRLQLSLVLEGVLSQILLRRAMGRGRVAAVEIMIGTDAIRNLIRDGKTEQIPTYMQTGSQHGMQTMDQALQDLIKSRIISLEEASSYHSKPRELMKVGV